VRNFKPLLTVEKIISSVTITLGILLLIAGLIVRTLPASILLLAFFGIFGGLFLLIYHKRKKREEEEEEEIDDLLREMTIENNTRLSQMIYENKKMRLALKATISSLQILEAKIKELSEEDPDLAIEMGMSLILSYKLALSGLESKHFEKINIYLGQLEDEEKKKRGFESYILKTLQP